MRFATPGVESTNLVQPAAALFAGTIPAPFPCSTSVCPKKRLTLSFVLVLAAAMMKRRARKSIPSSVSVVPLSSPVKKKPASAPQLTTPGRSLATGHFSLGQGVHVLQQTPSPSAIKARRPSLIALIKESSTEAIHSAKPVFQRCLSSFLRTADLDMDETCSDTASERSYPNYSYAAADPPPGMEWDPDERWISLDDGDGSHAPVAPMAVRALAKTGLVSVYDKDMWTADSKTLKLDWPMVWQQDGPVELPHRDLEPVLVWTGTFSHGLYGSDLPAVRAAGVIDVSADELFHLLVDSSRVEEYNKLSLGRHDLLVLQPDMESDLFGGITKVMRSSSKPPLVRKTLTFTSLMHARRLVDDSGYKIVTRAVTSPEDASVTAALKSEILMGVNIIKRTSDPHRCLLISVNHIRSPMVPQMIAKRIGLSAAVGFVQDLRAATKDARVDSNNRRGEEEVCYSKF